MIPSHPQLYDSANRRAPPLRELLDLLRYGDLLGLLIGESIKVRYKRSALGVLWALLNPLLHMLVLSLAFSGLFRANVANYPLYVLIGTVSWAFFTQSSALAIDTTVSGGNLIKRIYVPRTIFAVAAIGNGLVNIGLSLVLLALITLATGHPIGLAWLFLPVAVALLAIFTLGIGLLVAALAIFFGDAAYLYSVLIQAWFFLTPIMYPVDIIPAGQRWLLALNPFYHLLALFREPLYAGRIPSAGQIAIAAAAALAALIIGWWVFTQRADELVYHT